MSLPSSSDFAAATVTTTTTTSGAAVSGSGSNYFQYKYAIHRAGMFYRYENSSDFSSIDTSSSGVVDVDVEDADDDGAIAMDIGSEEDPPTTTTTTVDDNDEYHKVPLRLLSNREMYVVNDVLGKASGPPDIDHNRLLPPGGGNNIRRSAGGGGFGGGGSGSINPNERTPSVATMHSRSSSFAQSSSFSSLVANKGGTAGAAAAGGGQGSGGVGSGVSSNIPATTARKKAVGFAPAPPPYHRPKPAAAVQAVHLNSTDGLVVVSAFLPVVLHRNEHTRQWSADWDYEALLSMQTHLRVTRIGVVKWRGWHGNYGKDGSPSTGVPIQERPLVEECLRPFHCVPVWMDTKIFGEM